MKAWRQFLAVLVTIAMLVPLTAISETEDGLLPAENAAAEETAPAPTDAEAPAPTDGEAPATDAMDGEAGEEVSSGRTDEEVPELQELALSADGAEANLTAGEADQEPVKQEVDFTAKKIELNMNMGTTMLVVPVNGTVQEPWSVPKAARGSVTVTLREDGVTEIAAKSPVKKAKLSAKVQLSTGKTKKITMTLNVNDPNAPRTITLSGMPTGGVPVGRMIDLSQYIVLDPPSATLDSVTIKVTGAARLDSSQYPYGMVTTKKGSAKIAITSRSDKKVKMKPFSLKVLDNKTTKMTPKPGKADMPNGWTMWPVSLEVKGSALKCQFNVINGTNDKMAQIENMTLQVAADRWDNIIAEGTLSRVSASVAKQKTKTVKFDLKINSENMKDVFLPEAWANGTLFFLINQDAVRLTGKKGESAGFVYSRYFPDPGARSSISLDRTEATATLGETLTLTATVSPADLAYDWFSSDESIATVADGVVMLNRVGTVTITAKAADASSKAECVVTIQEPEGGSVKVTGITLSASALSMTGGGTKRLTASLAPEEATVRNVKWSSDNTAVATVDRTGLVTAVSAGTAKITATAADGSGIVSDACVVTVNEATDQGDFVMNGGVVTGYKGQGGAIVIPDKDSDGNPITAIGEAAFKDNTAITEVVISSDVTELRDSAFEGCASLQKVTAPNHLNKIGKAAFKNCSKLQKMEVFE